MTSSDNDVASALEQELRQAEIRKTGCYDKRTRHQDARGITLFINRLINEDSPYLLQHAHNPVNWYPWGEEAFAAAQREDKPVFLSIGYSTCHWCHVMEVESFDNVEVARLLNQHFICIKLDREQYPDIDDIYMTGVQIMSGQGGWPMSNFLLADGKPFYSATYFPPQQFMALLNQIASVWQEKRVELAQSATRISDAIEQILQGRHEVCAIELEQVTAAANKMLEREDRALGGLAGAPKFPQEPLLFYFLDNAIRQRDVGSLGFVTRALNAMACGGIYDQVGGGFHRYSTDANWLVPHFEKMLYNQSQLALIYLQAWRLTGSPFFKRIVRQTLDYVLREMQRPEGGFYSATDADSEEQEGLYFIWTLDELGKILTREEMILCSRIYELSPGGNFEGANILALVGEMGELAGQQPFDEFESALDKMLLKLREVRQHRIAPLLDDKLIVGWSAAMASSLAWAGYDLQEPAYIEAAEKAVKFIWENCFSGHESMRRIYLNDMASIPAQLEDYATLSEACITLFDVTADKEYLQQAEAIMAQALELFWNEKSGGFYLSQQLEQGPMLARSSSASDGATLSAYAVAINCLVSLARRSALLESQPGDSSFVYQEKIHQCLNTLGEALNQQAASHTTLIRAINHHRLGGSDPIQYAGTGQLKAELRRQGSMLHPGKGGEVKIILKLTLAPGMHVTAPGGELSEQVPLSLSLADNETHWHLEKVDYPQPVEIASAPGQAGYEGIVELQVVASALAKEADPLSASIGLSLQVQLCNEQLCLPVETLVFRV